MAGIKAVLFDFGGTLFDYTSDKIAHLKLMEEVVKKYRVEDSPEVLEDKYSNYMWKVYLENNTGNYDAEKDLNYKAFKNVLNEYGKDIGNSDKIWFEKEMIKEHCEHVYLFSESVNTLNALKDMGLYLGMITDFEEDFLFCLLEKLKIKHIFDVIVCSGQLRVNKPDPYIFNFALKELKIKPQEAIYVGDNPQRDIHGAKKVGMKTVYISSNGLKMSESDYNIKNIHEIIFIAKELKG